MPDHRALIDDLLEASVVGSFSRIGYAVRRRLFAWPDPEPGALAGRTALVTGPTSGLGRATAEAFTRLGARVILVGRDEGRLAGLRDELAARHDPSRIASVVADMSSPGSVRAAVAAVSATEARLDVVVDNAGAMFARRTVTAEGVEATLATMVVGPFVLVAGLLPLLRASGVGRIISVTSGGMYAQPLDLDDLQSAHSPYDGPRAYARAKRAQVALVREWARRLRGDPLRPLVSAMHPGWADTPGLASSLPTFHRALGPLLRSPAEGIDTVTWLATTADRTAAEGRLFLDRRPRPFDRIGRTKVSAAERRRLWQMVVTLAGEADPAPDVR